MKVTFSVPKFIKPSLYNDYKYSMIASGRRTGKTYNAVQWLLENLLTNEDKSGIWVDTRQSNIQAYVERYFIPMLKPIWHLCKWNGQRYILTLPSGSYIDFGSAERPENLEGFQYDYGVLNEAGIILKKESLWYNTLQPMFKGNDTKVRIIGTPKSKNMFHKLYEKGRTDDDMYKSFHYSAYDSPFWESKDLDRIEREVPAEVWRQEYLAEFLEGAGSVFRNITQCIRQPQPDLKPDIMAVDLAKHQDFTVITLANQGAQQVISQDRFNQIDWSFQKNRILNTWENNNKPKLIIDSTGVGDSVYDDLRNAGVQVEGFKFTNSSKNELIQNLSIAMDNQHIFIPSIPNLLSELEVFAYDVSPSGNIKYNAPDGFHDDAVISLALANHLIKNKVSVSLSWV